MQSKQSTLLVQNAGECALLRIRALRGGPWLCTGTKFARRVLTACWDTMLEVLSVLLNGTNSCGVASSLGLLLGTDGAKEDHRKAREAVANCLDGLQRAAKLYNVLGKHLFVTTRYNEKQQCTIGDIRRGRVPLFQCSVCPSSLFLFWFLVLSSYLLLCTNWDSCMHAHHGLPQMVDQDIVSEGIGQPRHALREPTLHGMGRGRFTILYFSIQSPSLSIPVAQLPVRFLILSEKQILVDGEACHALCFSLCHHLQVDILKTPERFLLNLD